MMICHSTQTHIAYMEILMFEHIWEIGTEYNINHLFMPGIWGQYCLDLKWNFILAARLVNHINKAQLHSTEFPDNGWLR